MSIIITAIRVLVKPEFTEGLDNFNVTAIAYRILQADGTVVDETTITSAPFVYDEVHEKSKYALSAELTYSFSGTSDTRTLTVRPDVSVVINVDDEAYHAPAAPYIQLTRDSAFIKGTMVGYNKYDEDFSGDITSHMQIFTNFELTDEVDDTVITSVLTGVGDQFDYLADRIHFNDDYIVQEARFYTITAHNKYDDDSVYMPIGVINHLEAVLDTDESLIEFSDSVVSDRGMDKRTVMLSATSSMVQLFRQNIDVYYLDQDGNKLNVSHNMDQLNEYDVSINFISSAQIGETYYVDVYVEALDKTLTYQMTNALSCVHDLRDRPRTLKTCDAVNGEMRGVSTGEYLYTPHQDGDALRVQKIEANTLTRLEDIVIPSLSPSDDGKCTCGGGLGGYLSIVTQTTPQVLQFTLLKDNVIRWANKETCPEDQVKADNSRYGDCGTSTVTSDGDYYALLLVDATHIKLSYLSRYGKYLSVVITTGEYTDKHGMATVIGCDGNLYLIAGGWLHRIELDPNGEPYPQETYDDGTHNKALITLDDGDPYYVYTISQDPQSALVILRGREDNDDVKQIKYHTDIGIYSTGDFPGDGHLVLPTPTGVLTKTKLGTECVSYDIL